MYGAFFLNYLLLNWLVVAVVFFFLVPFLFIKLLHKNVFLTNNIERERKKIAHKAEFFKEKKIFYAPQFCEWMK